MWLRRAVTVPTNSLGAMLSLDMAFGSSLPGILAPLASWGIDAVAPWPTLAFVSGTCLCTLAAFVHSGAMWLGVSVNDVPGQDVLYEGVDQSDDL
jgi:hypothetical protein